MNKTPVTSETLYTALVKVACSSDVFHSLLDVVGDKKYNQLFASLKQVLADFCEKEVVPVLEMSQTEIDVRAALITGTVWLKYKKQIDGEIVLREGTTNLASIPYEQRVIASQDYNTKSNKTHGTVRYYDITMSGWRSFKINNLIDFR